LCPRLASSTGSEPTTSPRPPVLDHGAHSVETKTIFMGLAALGVYPESIAAHVCSVGDEAQDSVGGSWGRAQGRERGLGESAAQRVRGKEELEGEKWMRGKSPFRFSRSFLLKSKLSATNGRVETVQIGHPGACERDQRSFPPVADYHDDSRARVYIRRRRGELCIAGVARASERTCPHRREAGKLKRNALSFLLPKTLPRVTITWRALRRYAGASHLRAAGGLDIRARALPVDEEGDKGEQCIVSVCWRRAGGTTVRAAPILRDFPLSPREVRPITTPFCLTPSYHGMINPFATRCVKTNTGAGMNAHALELRGDAGELVHSGGGRGHVDGESQARRSGEVGVVRRSEPFGAIGWCPGVVEPHTFCSTRLLKKAKGGLTSGPKTNEV